MSESGRGTEVKVGLFVLLGIATLTTVLVLLGQKKHVFQHRVKVHSVFPDVAGLVVGAPVQVAGVNVGTVSNIAFDRSQSQPRIRVDFEITQETLDLMRADSIARISSQGLLGDKLIDVTPGTVEATPIAAGGLVASTPPADIDHLMAEATKVMKKLDRVAAGAAVLAEELSSDSARADIRGSLAAVHTLLEATAHGRGLAHALFFDHRTADSVRGLAGGVERLVDRVSAVVASLEPIFKATDHDGKQLVNNLSRAAAGVGLLAGQLRESQVVSHLERASGDLAQVAGQLRHGEGTLGALVQDPTVYEQLVTILGGVGRSRVLRALVRYAISKDDNQTAKRIAEPPPGRRQGKR